MIAIDTNILVYAHRVDSPWHERAEKAVRSVAEGTAPWGIPWPSIHEFLAIITHPRIYDPPTPLGKAWDQVEGWIGSPSLNLLTEIPEYPGVLARVLRASRVTGPQIHDARIAALCMAHGVRELWSADRDFSRFAGLRVRNPLTQS